MRKKSFSLLKGFSYIIPLLIIVVAGFNIPLLLMLIRSFRSPNFTLEHYTYLIEHPIYLQILANTFQTAIVVSILCILLSYPLAHWLTRLKGKIKLFMLSIIAMSFLVSILIRTYAWIVILGNNGIINRNLLELGLIGSPLQLIYNDVGVTLGTINVLIPFAVFPLYAAMLKIDKRIIKAAYSLGSNPLNVFFRVYLPLTLPTLLSSVILIFIMTLGFFITPAILGGGKVQMIATILDTLINRLANWNLASAISTILLVVTLILYSIYRKIGETVK
jgi:putative spermidine/putrescine transport system permease protein